MVIITHGGAGRIEIEDLKKRRGVIISVSKKGHEVLESTNSALDAATEVVVQLEDNPLFNAGTGAVLSLAGQAELDAAVMTGDLQAGAVACITEVKNPVLVARKVMEESDHVLLSGEGAVRFARFMGFPAHNVVTEQKQKLLQKRLKDHESLHHMPKITKYVREFGTVGACAWSDGKLAAAGSTGGMVGHLPGRIGDTPMIGGGIYANEFGAVTCTGHGECILKLCLAKSACDAMKSHSAQEAIDMVLNEASRFKCKCGLIAVDKDGNVGLAFNTKEMIWAYSVNGKITHF
jgi:beta-aspartyl-peptidase (threonine type)